MEITHFESNWVRVKDPIAFRLLTEALDLNCVEREDDPGMFRVWLESTTIKAPSDNALDAYADMLVADQTMIFTGETHYLEKDIVAEWSWGLMSDGTVVPARELALREKNLVVV